MRVATIDLIRKNVVTHNEILPRQNIRECPWDIEGLSHLTRLEARFSMYLVYRSLPQDL